MQRVVWTALAGVVLMLCAQPAAWSEDVTPGPLADDPRVTDAIDAWLVWLEYQLAMDGVPAASVAMVHDQELLVARAFGFANPAAGRPATTDTIYSICSNSKLFTSIAIMQLRDAGKLGLDDELGLHLDWFDIQDVHPDDEPITIRRILTHSSGLPRESDYPYWTGPDFTFPTHDQIVERLGGQTTLYPSGRYFQYSNLGLTLAGEIVSAASGRSFDEYIRTEILEPLGMTDTYTEIPGELHGGQLAVGFSARRRDGTRDQLPLFQSRGIAPAAGFASTVEDLARFLSWQLRLLSGGGTEVLRAATLREMQRVHWVDPDWKTTWGLGFVVRKVGDGTFVEHGGACPGYYSQVTVHPKSKLGVVVLSNAIGTDVDFFVEQAVELVAPAVVAAESRPAAEAIRDPQLDRYVGVYRSAWGEGAIVRWGDGLGLLPLETRNPRAALQKLQKIADRTFRRIRDDDGSLGETVVFEVDPDGAVTRMKQHSNWMEKVN